MNKREYLEQLALCLCQIRYHERVLAELLALLKNTGCEGKFLDTFVSRLNFLNQYGRRASDLAKEFERISEKIYSLHIRLRDKNIRILYSFATSGAVLLLAFHERSGKRATDYSRELPTAILRLSEMEDDHV